MAINSVTDLRNTDPGQTALTVRHNPVGGSTNCHAVQVTQAARSGSGAGINVVSDNPDAPAVRGRGAGSLFQLYDASNTLRFEIDNTGVITTGSLGGAASFTSLAVSGTTVLSGALNSTASVNLTGALASTDVLTAKVTGDVQPRAVFNAGGGIDFGPGNGAVDTNLYRGDTNLLQTDSGLTVGGALNVSGYATLAGGQANGDFAVFGALSLLGAALGFFGTTATSKKTVSGSRGGNAALASLITALASYGLITDGSSA